MLRKIRNVYIVKYEYCFLQRVLTRFLFVFKGGYY
jgi:hypothetical protein